MYMEFNKKGAKQLERLAVIGGVDADEVVGRAIILYEFLCKEICKGREIHIVMDGKAEKNLTWWEDE